MNKRLRFCPISLVVIVGMAFITPVWGQQASWQYGSTTISAASGTSVGIGTASPATALDVLDGGAIRVGAAYMGAGYPSAGMATFGSNVYYNGSAWVIPDSTRTSQLIQSYNGALYFLNTHTNGGQNWSYNMTLNNNGTVGIGTYGANQNAQLAVSLNTTAPGANATYAATFTGGNVGIGTTSPQYPLAVNGTIQAKEVIVNTGWSDYVFVPGYPLKSLEEIAEYINHNHHLPDIPSEEEVREKGVSLGEVQAKLLAKIEELTLLMIQADERNNQLVLENRRLEARINRLEAHEATMK